MRQLVKSMAVLTGAPTMGKNIYEELLSHLKLGQYLYYPIKGKEHSVVIYNIAQEDAMYLGNQFNQMNVDFFTQESGMPSFEETDEAIKVLSERSQIVPDFDRLLNESLEESRTMKSRMLRRNILYKRPPIDINYWVEASGRLEELLDRYNGNPIPSTKKLYGFKDEDAFNMIVDKIQEEMGYENEMENIERAESINDNQKIQSAIFVIGRISESLNEYGYDCMTEKTREDLCRCMNLLRQMQNHVEDRRIDNYIMLGEDIMNRYPVIKIVNLTLT